MTTRADPSPRAASPAHEARHAAGALRVLQASGLPGLEVRAETSPPDLELFAWCFVRAWSAMAPVERSRLARYWQAGGPVLHFTEHWPARTWAAVAGCSRDGLDLYFSPRCLDPLRPKRALWTMTAAHELAHALNRAKHGRCPRNDLDEVLWWRLGDEWYAVATVRRWGLDVDPDRVGRLPQGLPREEETVADEPSEQDPLAAAAAIGVAAGYRIADHPAMRGLADLGHPALTRWMQVNRETAKAWRSAWRADQ